jgi:hypothetical protein
MKSTNNTINNESLIACIHYYIEHDLNDVLLSYAILKDRNYNFDELLIKKLNDFASNFNYSNIDDFLNIQVQKLGFLNKIDFIDKSKFINLYNNNYHRKNLYQSARSGVILFCVLHLLFEVIINNLYKWNVNFILLPVIFNYFISIWYIKYNIYKSGRIRLLFGYGFLVSLIVFVIRIVVGFGIIQLLNLNG